MSIKISKNGRKCRNRSIPAKMRQNGADQDGTPNTRRQISILIQKSVEPDDDLEFDEELILEKAKSMLFVADKKPKRDRLEMLVKLVFCPGYEGNRS